MENFFLSLWLPHVLKWKCEEIKKNFHLNFSLLSPLHECQKNFSFSFLFLCLPQFMIVACCTHISYSHHLLNFSEDPLSVVHSKIAHITSSFHYYSPSIAAYLYTSSWSSHEFWNLALHKNWIQEKKRNSLSATEHK